MESGQRFSKLYKSSVEGVEFAVFLLVSDLAPIHFHLMSECIHCAADRRDSAEGCFGVVWKLGQGMKGGDFVPCLVIFTLQVVLRNLDVAHGHANVAMAKDFLQNREADAGPQHHGGESMPQLVKPNGRATRS